ncbi:hypothetical protein CGLAMM_10630 [Acetobacteraceae bacterium EV16G]|uniref:Nudix hydrolase domain-containing protein n=2 Tax=Sorlinia euscelidii TaxID=3081148 RepID=A0ABU7U1B1_9PROT
MAQATQISHILEQGTPTQTYFAHLDPGKTGIGPMSRSDCHPSEKRAHPRPTIATLAVTLRDDSVLLVRRNNASEAARWGLPGGEVNWGETILDAAQREMSEESGLTTRPRHAFSAHEIIETDDAGNPSRHIIFIAVLCAWIDGQPGGGDDAHEARWFRLEDLANPGLNLNANVVEIVRQAAAFHHDHAFGSSMTVGA